VAELPTYAAVASRRYDSLWPQENGRVTRIGISPDTGKLFLAASHEALIFALRPSPPRTVRTAFWSVAVTPDAYYTVARSTVESDVHEATTVANPAPILLVERRFDQNRPRAFALAWPSSTPSQPWGLAVTPDGRTAAVLCQESDNTTVSGLFYEKHLLIYALPSTPSTSSPVPIARQIHLSELSGADGRGNGRPVFSPDGKTLFYYTSSGNCFAYAVETGALIWSASSGGSIAVSPSGDLVASGDYRTSSPIEVRDVATGRIIYTSPKSHKVRKLALTFDHKLLAAVDEETFLTIDLASGADSSRRSLLCPVTVSPDGTRLVAFLPEEPGKLTGSTVLADTHTGRIIEVLNASAHLLNVAAFTPQGDRIVLGRNRYSVTMIAADPWERLAAALEIPGYPFTALPRDANGAQFATPRPPPLAPLPAAGGGSAPVRPILRANDGAALIAHLGAEIEAEGTIASAWWNSSGSIMMIEFEGGNGRGLLAAVFAGDRNNFDAAFPPGADAFLPGKKVRIRGKLEKYGGRSERYMHNPQIVLHSPDQLTVLADAPASTSAGLRIDATNHPQLAAHLNSDVTVFGTVRTAAWTVNESIFNMDFEKDDEHGLLVVIFPRNRAAFERSLGGDIEKALTGKTIELKGELVTYGGRVEAWKNRPQIILNSPSQLLLLPVNASPGTQ
jgi:DNA/RNA endonuclease YhcR with UshA esterase domain/DNA-binding beta-propeller fold protein YncE